MKVYRYQKGDYESMRSDALKFAKERYFNGYSDTLSVQENFNLLTSFIQDSADKHHTVYPVTPNAGMFYQRGYKHLRRGNTQGKKHAIHAFPLFLFLILLFRLYVKESFLEIMERQNNRLV